MAYTMDDYKAEIEPHAKAIMLATFKLSESKLKEVVAATPTGVDDMAMAIALPIVEGIVPKFIESIKL